MAERDDDGPDRIEEEFTVDAGSIELQLEREERTFAFRAIADDDKATRIEIDDSDWDLLHYLNGLLLSRFRRPAPSGGSGARPAPSSPPPC